RSRFRKWEGERLGMATLSSDDSFHPPVHRFSKYSDQAERMHLCAKNSLFFLTSVSSVAHRNRPPCREGEVPHSKGAMPHSSGRKKKPTTWMPHCSLVLRVLTKIESPK